MAGAGAQLPVRSHAQQGCVCHVNRLLKGVATRGAAGELPCDSVDQPTIGGQDQHRPLWPQAPQMLRRLCLEKVAPLIPVEGGKLMRAHVEQPAEEIAGKRTSLLRGEAEHFPVDQNGMGLLAGP